MEKDSKTLMESMALELKRLERRELELKKILKALGKDEILWVTYCKSSTQKPKYCITSTRTRQTYILYEVKQNGLERIGKASNPMELEKKYKKLFQEV